MEEAPAISDCLDLFSHAHCADLYDRNANLLHPLDLQEGQTTLILKAEKKIVPVTASN